jgi:hypothetical protein
MKKNKNKKRFYSFSLHAVDLEGRAYIAERERERKREMDLVANKVQRSEIKLGDHIYTYRAVVTYSHHGLSVSLYE